MSDPRSVIERELERVDLRPFTIQAFHRRREQKRRRQRIAAGVVGVTVGLLAVLIGTSIVRSESYPRKPSSAATGSATGRADVLGRCRDRCDRPRVGTTARRRPRRVGRRRLMVSGRLGPGVRIHDRAVLGRHPRHRDGRGSRPCELRLTHALRRERRLVRGRRMDRVLDVIERRAREPGQTDRLDPPRRNGGEAGHGYRRSPDRAAGPFSLSPDGSAVVFGAGREIDVMNVDGTGRRFLANGMWPDWSTDGSTIAFARDPNLPPSQRGSGDPFVWQFWSILPDGSGLTKLHGWPHCCLGAWAAGPMWSPDGAQIAGGALNRLRVIDADGHGARTIRGVTITSGPLTWRPSP